MTNKPEKLIIKTLTHSSKFVEKWKLFLQEVYGYENYMDYMIVPSITGKKTLSYLPLLNYTDRLSSEVDDLLELGRDNSYQIRVLNPEYQDFQVKDTVNMRIDISSGEADYVFNNVFDSRKCRNQIKKSQKSGLSTLRGSSEKFIYDFYELYKSNMHYHGTPALKKCIIKTVLRNIESSIFVTYSNTNAVSAFVLVEDDEIALALWAGIDHEYLPLCPNHNMYWEALKYSIERGKKVFDFGRSPYGGATYHFKKQWGAEPIKIDILRDRIDDDIYEKYNIVSKVWKKLPPTIVNVIGPKLCKYLEDL